jgi:hypothetical protein
MDHSPPASGSAFKNWYSLSLESYVNDYNSDSDFVFFGLIPDELIVQKLAFPKTSSQRAVTKGLVVENKRQTIPTLGLLVVQKLICKCWKRERWCRPTFDQILNRLEAMQFKLTANVKSLKLCKSVKSVKDWTETNDGLTARAHYTLPQFVSQLTKLRQQETGLATVGHAMFSRSFSIEVGNVRLLCLNYRPRIVEGQPVVIKACPDK